MKILHRFCSDEVMTLLERMDTFPDEFLMGNEWNDFLPITGQHFKHFNLAERILIQKSWDRLKDTYFPRKARAAIIKTLMRGSESKSSSILTTAAITQNALDVLHQELARTRYADIIKGE
jgi:hypothetical protein